MIKKTVVTIAVSAIACAALASSASAKHHMMKHKMHAAHAMHSQTMDAKAYPAPYASSGIFETSDIFSANNHASEPMPGVNPMTSAPAIPAVAHPQPFTRVPGVNPM